ncbi:MAG: hypothetical protein M3P34_03145 [Actinomycetota bacterium]|nr:hypothetical protein [Actinomycetota bacterium]
MRHPHPEVLQILDPRPLLDEAASIGSRYRTGGLLVTETLAAGLTYGHQLWFGTERNIGRRLAESPMISTSTSTSPTTPESTSRSACAQTSGLPQNRLRGLR